MTYLAVPISGKNLAAARGQVDSACAGGAEMLELRVDYLEDLSRNTLLELINIGKQAGLPLIVTCRDKTEGGAADLSSEFRVEMLAAAVECGVEFVDCEYANFKKPEVGDTLRQAIANTGGKTRLIISTHDFAGCFDDLEELYNEIYESCPEAVVKLVYTPGHINECFAAFDLLRNKKGDAIVLCMGEDGMISRVLAKKFGSMVTFASLNDEAATAPGQVGLNELKGLYRWDRIDCGTKIYGVIGNPIGHSLSPAIFNACFEEQGVNAVYLPVLVRGEKKEFSEFMAAVAEGGYGFAGFSVTIPHKAHALDFVEGEGEYLEPLAASIGAVNTLKVGYGGLVTGYNTDYAGAMNALLAVMGIGRHELHNVRTAVLGAGGAARAIVAGLADVGADITIYNRTVAKAEALAEEFKCKYAPIADAAEMDAQVVVNCTSIGMHPNVDASPVPAESIKGDMVVFDTVYNPFETLLLKYAARAGAKTINGAEMFIRQAMAQYKLFTGDEADEGLMRRTVSERLLPGR